MEFKLQTEYIELIKLLKTLRLVESGGMAKNVVDEGYVLRNGEVETRKRAKLVKGDIIEFNGDTVRIV
ncbi:MAG: RNA-binding S4 domain-containing protein [Mangrovibacterium sp.]